MECEDVPVWFAKQFYRIEHRKHRFHLGNDVQKSTYFSQAHIDY